MKKRLLLLIPILLVSLAGCKNRHYSSQSGGGSGGNNIDPTSSTTIEIYATNDMHGIVQEEYGRTGMPKLMTYLNDKGKEANTLLLDQGDSWQGSIYSNYNHGGLITDLMNCIHYDVRTVGNHDFDWGVDYLKANTAKSYNGYATPVLAGNIYDYDFATKTVGSHQQSDIGGTSVTYTLDNGLKVGILGCIGEEQITSITSLYTKDICFTNHINFIKSEATHLRNDEHCDIVIASIHTGQEDVTRAGLSNYVDLVLCGHTHKQEATNEGNLFFIQSSAYTESIGHITLTYNYEQEGVVQTACEWIEANEIKNKIQTIDPTIQQIVNSYNQECEGVANEVLARNVDGEFSSSREYPNLMCKAIMDQCIIEGHNDVILSYVNKARDSNYNYTWTYADLYQAFPFDNTVYITEITGDELLRQVKKYNYICRNSSYTNNEINRNSKYKIAVLDYLYFHTDEYRDYDYFPTSADTSTITLTKNYREILRDWLRAGGYTNGGLKASDYSSSLWQFNRNAFVEA